MFSFPGLEIQQSISGISAIREPVEAATVQSVDVFNTSVVDGYELQIDDRWLCWQQDEIMGSMSFNITTAATKIIIKYGEEIICISTNSESDASATVNLHIDNIADIAAYGLAHSTTSTWQHVITAQQARAFTAQTSWPHELVAGAGAIDHGIWRHTNLGNVRSDDFNSDTRASRVMLVALYGNTHARRLFMCVDEAEIGDAPTTWINLFPKASEIVLSINQEFAFSFGWSLISRTTISVATRVSSVRILGNVSRSNSSYEIRVWHNGELARTKIANDVSQITEIAINADFTNSAIVEIQARRMRGPFSNLRIDEIIFTI